MQEPLLNSKFTLQPQSLPPRLSTTRTRAEVGCLAVLPAHRTCRKPPSVPGILPRSSLAGRDGGRRCLPAAAATRRATCSEGHLLPGLPAVCPPIDACSSLGRPGPREHRLPHRLTSWVAACWTPRHSSLASSPGDPRSPQGSPGVWWAQAWLQRRPSPTPSVLE